MSTGATHRYRVERQSLAMTCTPTRTAESVHRTALAGQNSTRSLTVLDPTDQLRLFTGQVARPSLEPAGRIPTGQQS